MFSKVNVTLLRQLGLHQALSLRHFQLHLFMFSKVNVTLLRQFLDFYCQSNFGLLLNHDAFLYHYYLGLHRACITFSYICSCSVK